MNTVCAVIRGPSYEEVEQQLTLAFTQCSLVELRFDLMEGWDLERLKSLRKRFDVPMIFTLRSKSQGGNFEGPDEKRLQMIRQLASLEPEYLDIESPADPEFVARLIKGHTKIILSFHDFHGMPSLSSTLEEMRRCPADIYKIAVTPSSAAEALELLIFMKDHPFVLAMGMGGYGAMTRILAPIYGACFTYASLNDELGTAPGQVTIHELENVYHHGHLNKGTALYGLIGDPVTKSLSHLSHNRAMKDLNLSSVYVKIPVPAQQLADFMKMARKAGIRGLSVTMPLKELVIPLLDFVDPWAQRIGAVNTLLFENGVIKGYNTDGKGALDAIEAKMRVKGKNIILVGSGGSCKAIAAEALDRGARVIIVNRTAQRAEDVSKLLGCQGGGLEMLEELFKKGYDVLVNTTPSSMPINPQWIYPKALAMDIALQPRMTEFLHQAEKKGCSLVFGYEMFINQALGQFKIWYGEAVDLDAVKAILQEVVKKNLA